MAKKTKTGNSTGSSKKKIDYKGHKIGGDAGQQKKGSGSDNRPIKTDDN